jgi:hypothetical protein
VEYQVNLVPVAVMLVMVVDMAVQAVADITAVAVALAVIQEMAVLVDHNMVSLVVMEQLVLALQPVEVEEE